jgi:hypothetical protein
MELWSKEVPGKRDGRFHLPCAFIFAMLHFFCLPYTLAQVTSGMAVWL